jgi:dephospho-CoA kinase
MNLRPLVVTGPIGSGKSTASKLFESFGAIRVDLDVLSREILESEPGISFVRGHWPQAVVADAVDRAKLAHEVFSDRSELRKLEAFVHPRVVELFETRFANVKPLVVEVSVPGLEIEDGFSVLVDTPEHLRIKRLLARGMTAEDIAGRIASQPGRSEWLKLADAVLSNSSGEAGLKRDAASLWEWWTKAGFRREVQSRST